MIDVHGLLEKGRRSSARVGIGLSKELFESSTRRLAEQDSKVRLDLIDDPHELVSALKDGSLDAAVRGTMSSVRTLAELKNGFSLKEIMRTAILEDVRGKQFLLTPVGIDEGLDVKQRLRLVLSSADYFSSTGWSMKIGVLSRGRVEDRGRSKEIRRSLDDGEKLVTSLRKQGVDAQAFAILIEDAVAEADLIVAPDGVSGNLIFRSMHFIGGGKAYGAPVVNLNRVFVDTSRAKADFYDSVLLAAGLVVAKAGLQKRSETIISPSSLSLR